MATEVFIIFILLLLNGFFSLSEMAIVSSSKPMLKQLAKKGDRRAMAALALAEDSGRFLSTVQVGITLVGILAGAFGGARIASRLEPFFKDIPFIGHHADAVAVTLVVTAITFLSVVIGELVPKQFALKRPEKLAMFVARPMAFLARICTPVVWMLEASASVIGKILGGETLDGERMTEAEVKAVLSEGAETGVIEKAEHDMLQRVIRLGDRDVKSIMTHRSSVVFIDINDPLEIVRTKVHEAGHSRYPVIEGNPDKVIGVVQAKEMLDGALSGGLKVSDYVKSVQTLPENATCLTAFDLFKKSMVHMVLVVNEYGSAEGIVTTADLLEAIVGMLPSNYDKPEHSMISKRQDGSWFVDGLTPIDEVHINIGLEEIKTDASFDTMAGFMLQHLGKSPEEGDYFDLFRHRFEVADMDDARIDKIVVTPLDEPDAEKTS